MSCLNEIRRGELSEATSRSLAACHVGAKPRPSAADGDCIVPTKLYCTNRRVDEENSTRLADLEGRALVYEALDSFGGLAATEADARKKISEGAESKVVACLKLKKGAQVVLLRNIDQEKGLVNGSRGVVVDFEPSDGGQGGRGFGHVPCPAGMLCPVVRFDCGQTRRIEMYETWIGRGALGHLSRVQEPLKLAWALTAGGAAAPACRHHPTVARPTHHTTLSHPLLFHYSRCTRAKG